MASASLTSKNKVTGTSPSTLYEVISIDSGLQTINSLTDTQGIPKEWTFSSKGPVTVLFKPSGSSTLTGITGGSSIGTVPGTTAPSTACGGSEGSLTVNISDIAGTVAGKSLGPGDKIIIVAKLTYALTGTTITTGYPCPDTDLVTDNLYTAITYSGTETDVTNSATLTVSKR